MFASKKFKPVNTLNKDQLFCAAIIGNALWSAQNISINDKHLHDGWKELKMMVHIILDPTKRILNSFFHRFDNICAYEVDRFV